MKVVILPQLVNSDTFVTEFWKITLMGAFCTLNIYLWKAAWKFCFFFIYVSNTVKMLWITRKSVEIFKMCFCDVSKIVVNSKILIVSGTPIRVIFQNSVTFIHCLPSYSILQPNLHVVRSIPENWARDIARAIYPAFPAARKICEINIQKYGQFVLHITDHLWNWHFANGCVLINYFYSCSKEIH